MLTPSVCTYLGPVPSTLILKDKISGSRSSLTLQPLNKSKYLEGCTFRREYADEGAVWLGGGMQLISRCDGAVVNPIRSVQMRRRGRYLWRQLRLLKQHVQLLLPLRDRVEVESLQRTWTQSKCEGASA